MTRRGSRAEGRTVNTRPPAELASYVTGDPIPADTPVLRCACGCAYRDHPDSQAAHLAVHGHRPIRKPASRPDREENA
jgi:hypothetical protein